MVNNQTKSLIYYMVSAYVGYMAFNIMNNRIHGDNTIAWPLAIIITAVMAAGVIGVAIYATRLWKKKSDDDVTSEDNNEDETPDDRI